jgi:hypothetical protein
MIAIGDILEIPLTDGRKAYGQFIYEDEKMGPLLQVFDLPGDQPVELDRLKDVAPLFPPVLVSLTAAVAAGIWKVVGRLTVDRFTYPSFVNAVYSEKTGQASKWFLWNGQNSVFLGNSLPDEYKKLEYYVIWSPADVVERIETGKVPFPYGDLIQNNAFTPRRAEIPAKKSWFGFWKKSA